MLILLSVFGLPVLVSLLIPRRWFTAWGLFIGLTVAALVLAESRTRGGGFGAAVAMGLLMLEVSIVFLVLFIRLYLKQTKKVTPSKEGVAAPAMVSWVLAAIGGAVALTALWVQVWNSALDSGIATHIAVALLAVVWFVFTPLLWSSRPPLYSVFAVHSANVFRLSGTATICATLWWSLQIGPKVVAAADAMAQGQPYCLLAAGTNTLRPVRSYFDLGGFVMQAGRGADRHAQLAIGDMKSPAWHYWSYRKEAFVPEFLGGVLTCTPQANWGQKISWFDKLPPEDENAQFWLSGGHWRIPKEFHGSGSAMPPTLHFYASGSAFSPPAETIKLSGPRIWGPVEENVDVLLCTPEKLHVWHYIRNAHTKVETVGEQYGLKKEQTQSTSSPMVQYIEYDRSGKARSWLRCESNEAFCHHAFVRKGIVLSFEHPYSEFPHWKSLQDALWLRVESFALVWPDAPVQVCSAR